MGKADYEYVIYHMRLQNGLVWTMPITLPIPGEKVEKLRTSKKAKLINDGKVYGVIEIKEVFKLMKKFMPHII